jgi:hypothetical protein
MAVLIQRIRTVLTAAVTWLVVLSTVLTIVMAELDEFAGIPPGVIRGIGTALAVVGVVLAIIRRVTPVLPDARGLAPVELDQPLTQHEADRIRLQALAYGDPTNAPP